MHAPDRIPDRMAIADLNAAWCDRLDASDTPGLVALYAADAVYGSPTLRCEGAAEIAAYFTARTAKRARTSRHLQSSLLVSFDGPDSARGTSVCLSFAQDGAPPLPIAPFLVADFHDRYVRDAGSGWLIAERIIRPVFTRG